MVIQEETKVSINDLISLANYRVVKGVVKPFKQLQAEFTTHMDDMFLNEDLADHVGEPCYYIYDDCDMGTRACYLGNKGNCEVISNIIDNLDNVIYDLLYPDILEQLERVVRNKEEINNLYLCQSYENLYNYIVNNNLINEVSDYEMSWLKVLAFDRIDLVLPIGE